MFKRFPFVTDRSGMLIFNAPDAFPITKARSSLPRCPLPLPYYIANYTQEESLSGRLLQEQHANRPSGFRRPAGQMASEERGQAVAREASLVLELPVTRGAKTRPMAPSGVGTRSMAPSGVGTKPTLPPNPLLRLDPLAPLPLPHPEHQRDNESVWIAPTGIK